MWQHLSCTSFCKWWKLLEQEDAQPGDVTVEDFDVDMVGAEDEGEDVESRNAGVENLEEVEHSGKWLAHTRCFLNCYSIIY